MGGLETCIGVGSCALGVVGGELDGGCDWM